MGPRERGKCLKNLVETMIHRGKSPHLENAFRSMGGKEKLGTQVRLIRMGRVGVRPEVKSWKGERGGGSRQGRLRESQAVAGGVPGRKAEGTGLMRRQKALEKFTGSSKGSQMGGERKEHTVNHAISSCDDGGGDLVICFRP